MPFERIETHADVWSRMQQLVEKNRVPQAFLLTGPRHARMMDFSNRLIARLICEVRLNEPCGECKACRFILNGTHPDVHLIRQDTPTSPIKIEQIRDLQFDVHQTPQCASHRFIVIESAEHMNTPAANALLKMLEEPPLHTHFILISEHLGTLPATVISRCQRYAFSGALITDYLSEGALYPENSPRALLFKNASMITLALTELLDKKTAPSRVATQWSTYALSDLLWFLYLFTAEALRCQLEGEGDQLPVLSRLDPMVLFNQLDRINTLTVQVNQHITLNQMLAIEALLIGYL
jgi:DNA polymerase-3 subunit delta'